jgi:signal transduction histidine kinase
MPTPNNDISIKLIEYLSTDMELKEFFDTICDIIDSFVGVRVKEIFMPYFDPHVVKSIRFAGFRGEDDQVGHKDRVPEKGLTEKLFNQEGNYLSEDDEAFNAAVEKGDMELIGIPFKYWVGIKMNMPDGYKIGIVIQGNDPAIKEHKESLETIIRYVAPAMNIWLARRDLKESNVQLKIVNQRLEDANAEIKRLISFISHNLGNKVGNIGDFVKSMVKYVPKILTLIQKEVESSEARKNKDALEYKTIGREFKEDVEHISALTQSMMVLFKSMLSFFRIGQKKFTPESINIMEMIQTSLEGLSKEITKKKITVKLGDSLNQCVLMFDKSEMLQIVDNIINNAVKYVRKNKGEIIISAKEDENNVCIRFTDNGIGISKNDILQIFDWYFRADNNKEEGHGIGLASVKAWLNKAGGSIECESEEGKGSTFTIVILKKCSSEEVDPHA